jgi:hypothetical protein
MSGLFSSPGKAAQQGASGYQGQAQQIVDQIENYTGQQQQAERGAIAGVGPNAYFQAAEKMNPGPYAVNPGGVQTFGAPGGPGTRTAAPGLSTGPLPPPWTPPGQGGGVKMQPGGPTTGMGTAPGGGEKNGWNGVSWNPQDHRYEGAQGWAPGPHAPDVMKLLPTGNPLPTGGGGEFGGNPGRGHGSP